MTALCVQCDERIARFSLPLDRDLDAMAARAEQRRPAKRGVAVAVSQARARGRDDE